MIHRALALLVCTCLADLAQAGPDEVTNRLMEEKVSLLDWGVFRVQLLLEKTNDLSSASVFFDWDMNQIKIMDADFTMMDQGLSDVTVAECEKWFVAVRRAGYVNEKTGKPYFGDSSLFAELFSHEGWTATINGKATEDVVKQIDQKIVLEYSIALSAENVGDVERLICTGPLLSDSFARQEVRKK